MPEELSIQERLQALAPKEDSPTRRALFEQFGPEKYADADYLNLLREALIDIYENGGGTGNGSTMDQDNIDIKKRVSITEDGLATVLMAVNNLTPYLVSEKESVLFVCVRRGGIFGVSSTFKYKMLNHGKGKYGRGFTQLLPEDLELIYANVPEESDIDDPSTDTISFGALTTQTVAEWLSTKTPSITIKPQDLGYTLFKGTVNGIATSYLWIGAPGRYGTGYLAAAMTDLQLLSGEDAPVRNLTLGTTSRDAYRGDYGEIAYQHTRTAGNPHATQMADIPLLITWLNDRLIGSRATDAEVQATAAPIAQNKYVDIIRLFNWFSWIKTQAWNFTGSLKKNNVDVATVNDLASHTDDYRRFHFGVSQTNNTVAIGPLFEKLTITALLPGEGTNFFNNFQLKRPGAAAPIRDALAQMQSDINALTAAQVTAGYTIFFRVVLVAGQSIGAGVFMAVKQA